MRTRASSTAAEAFLARLRDHGIEYIFANGGTDFAPLIEALAKGKAEGAGYPEAIVMPHEGAAVGMAHGYYLASGRPQCVMAHTNVGLANCVIGLINAAAEQIPMFVCSGRTPVTEAGRAGSRTAPINWGQDMRDQAALVRESVKWDSELRYPDQAPELVDRAMSIALTPPKGPVYVSLPREALCAPAENLRTPPPPLSAPAVAPSDEAIERAAAMITEAQSPMIIAQRVESEAGFTALRAFAEHFAIPVVEFWPSRNSLSTESPMHAGYDPHEDLATADLVIVQDALVPWLPSRGGPGADCKIIHVGEDPLHARFPARGFRADLALVGNAATVYPALGAALGKLNRKTIEAHSASLAARNAARRERRIAKAKDGAGSPMTPAWVSHCLSQALGPDGIVVSEMGADPAYMDRPRAKSYFGHALSGGLGSGLPMALGVQLAHRDRIVAATVGDGAYIFANPPACHQIAEALSLPVLTIVMNNGNWNAVKRATLDLFPDGHAARANLMPVTSLEPAPDYCKIAEASRAYAERVERGSDLPAALARAIGVIRKERRQALLDVVVAA